jgi:hypothetical protein
MVMSNKLERRWKEVMIVHFSVLSQHLPAMTNKDHEIYRTLTALTNFTSLCNYLLFVNIIKVLAE